VTIIDKSVNERLKLIEQLEEEDKNAVYRIIDTYPPHQPHIDR